MNGRERGFLLLGSALGDPERKRLTVPQLRVLAQRVRTMDAPEQQRQLTEADLTALGYGREMALRILALLDQESLLDVYLHRARTAGCTPVTRVTEGYPQILRRRLGDSSPACLWAKGDLSFLDAPGIALVGSRDLQNLAFARETGLQAARQGYVLISGNARGADRTAQDAALEAGGRVISVVADSLADKQPMRNLLYLSEEDFDFPFSPQRALSRNRIIHALGQKTLVAQCSPGTGGTWDGTVKNLRYHWSPVFCYDDGSEGACQLHQMGASCISMEDLVDFGALSDGQSSFLPL